MNLPLVLLAICSNPKVQKREQELKKAEKGRCMIKRKKQ